MFPLAHSLRISLGRPSIIIHHSTHLGRRVQVYASRLPSFSSLPLYLSNSTTSITLPSQPLEHIAGQCVGLVLAFQPGRRRALGAPSLYRFCDWDPPTVRLGHAEAEPQRRAADFPITPEKNIPGKTTPSKEDLRYTIQHSLLVILFHSALIAALPIAIVITSASSSSASSPLLPRRHRLPFCGSLHHSFGRIYFVFLEENKPLQAPTCNFKPPQALLRLCNYPRPLSSDSSFALTLALALALSHQTQARSHRHSALCSDRST